MRKFPLMQKAARVAFAVLVVAMLFLFFSNDFGLVDIHKASIVVAVGVDVTENGYEVTAQAAVPTPAQSGSNEQYTQVTGSGATVADAVDDINAKTGFYPKLAFCNLVILGESCAEQNIFTVLDYFYRNDYVPLTALVSMCGGSAKDLLGKKPSDGSMSASAIQRAMSEELRNSANASTINLKLLAQDGGSPSAAVYMPYITAQTEGGGSERSASSGSQGSGGTSGGSAGGEQGKSSEGAAQFTCFTTAAFSRGRFVGILDEDQAFALNLLCSSVRLAVVNSVCDGENYTVGLKNNSAELKMGEEGGAPLLKIKYRALANVQAAESKPAAEGSANSHLVSQEVLNATAKTVEERINSLLSFCRENKCDLLGTERMLYQFRYKDYQKFKDDVLSVLKVEYDIKIKSVR